MKYKLDVFTTLLVITTVSTCIIKQSYNISIIILGLLAHNLINRYLSMKQEEVSKNTEALDALSNKIITVEEKVSALVNKDAVKDMMGIKR